MAVEAAGAFFTGVLILAAADFLGDSVVPRWWAVIPALFGVAFTVIVVQLVRRAGWRFVYVLWAQGWVLTAGIVGLVFGGEPALWVAILMAVGGIALTVLAQLEENRFA